MTKLISAFRKFSERSIINEMSYLPSAIRLRSGSANKYISIKVKVKVKFLQEQATKVQSGSTGIALLFL